MPEENTKQYTVRRALHHDGVAYMAGTAIKLQQGTADYLLSKGMIIDPSAPKKAATKEAKA